MAIECHQLTENVLVEGGFEFGHREDTPAAWHKKGVKIPTDLAGDAWSFSSHAGVAWGIKMVPYRVIRGLPEVCELADCFGQYIIRDDGDKRHLATVGSKWTPHQWVDSCRNLQVLLDTGRCRMSTVGSLSGGTTIFASLEFHKMEVRTGDVVTSHFHHVVRNEYASNFTGIWDLRMVCRNTVSRGMAAASSAMRIRHGRDVTLNVKTAIDAINVESETFARKVEGWQKLAQVSLAPSDIREYVQKVFDVDPSKEEVSTKLGNQLDKVVNMALFGMGNNGSSLWDAFNGVTQFLSHESGHNANTRTESLWFGSAGKRLERAAEIAAQMAS